MQSIWELILFYNLQIVLPCKYTLDIPHINNKLIVQEVIDLNIFNEEELYFINLVHINLKVIFLLELLIYLSNKI